MLLKFIFFLKIICFYSQGSKVLSSALRCLTASLVLVLGDDVNTQSSSKQSLSLDELYKFAENSNGQQFKSESRDNLLEIPGETVMLQDFNKDLYNFVWYDSSKNIVPFYSNVDALSVFEYFLYY